MERGGPRPMALVEVPAANSIAQRSAARSRPRAEGCNSQAVDAAHRSAAGPPISLILPG